MRKLTNFTTGILLASIFFLSACADSASDMGAPSRVGGTGGSMARFAISGDHLYTVDDESMRLFDITNPADPKKGERVELGFGIETVFPYGEHLFIGSMNGMHIYDIKQPASPQFLSTYSHITSCDPVVVQGNYAYVTLRTAATRCNRGEDRLDILNVANPSNPKLIRSYMMTNPHGLGISDSTLFICEGDYGLKVFDVDEEANFDIELMQHVGNIHAYDVIPHNDLLILTGNDGIYQYDYSQPDSLVLLSVMSIAKI